MSNDQPTPPEPNSADQPTSEVSPTAPKSSPPVSPTRKPAPSFLKVQAIKVLRAAIALLEKIIAQLEAEPTDAATTGVLATIQRVGQPVLATVRAVLPATVNQKLSDTALTGAIATILVAIISTTYLLIPGKPAPQVATVPPREPITPPVTATQPEPPKEPIAPKLPRSVPTPTELTAPTEPTPVEVVPPPAPKLTPEQKLIASIQDQVAESTNKYADGLIESIQANFRGSLLAVKISNEWYNLTPSRQDKLAADMLKRSQELDFSQLEIVDSQGTVVARSPVVGSQVVILNRRLNQDV